MNNKTFIAAAVDAGSSYVRAVICAVENGCIEYRGAGIVAAAGFTRSRVSDRQALSSAILRAVQMAEHEAGVQVEAVTIGCGGTTIKGANTRSRIETGRPREIEQRDVNRAFERAARVQLPEDRAMLQLCPQDFVMDDRAGYRDPRKMMASMMEAHAHVITVASQEHSLLMQSVNQAHLGVEETVFEAIASCYACVPPEDRREGLALLDIGQHSSELVVYHGDALQLASSLALSGDHFTRDIAHFLRIQYDDALLVKEQYGSASASTTARNSFIELPVPEGREQREAARRSLNEIIEARATEMFQLVRQELARVGMERSLAGGLVICGGGAELHGLCDVAEQVLECPARIGLPYGIRYWPEELEAPSWATVAGLAMYSARMRCNTEPDKPNEGILARILK
jgi:cell division protein FtsA